MHIWAGYTTKGTPGTWDTEQERTFEDQRARGCLCGWSRVSKGKNHRKFGQRVDHEGGQVHQVILYFVV